MRVHTALLVVLVALSVSSHKILRGTRRVDPASPAAPAAANSQPDASSAQVAAEAEKLDENGNPPKDPFKVKKGKPKHSEDDANKPKVKDPFKGKGKGKDSETPVDSTPEPNTKSQEQIAAEMGVKSADANRPKVKDPFKGKGKGKDSEPAPAADKKMEDLKAQEAKIAAEKEALKHERETLDSAKQALESTHQSIKDTLAKKADGATKESMLSQKEEGKPKDKKHEKEKVKDDLPKRKAQVYYDHFPCERSCCPCMSKYYTPYNTTVYASTRDDGCSPCEAWVERYVEPEYKSHCFLTPSCGSTIVFRPSSPETVYYAD
eukprot:CAMPEP_0197540738 /NCGR_PEP_ID=MMETSP1318-20131121/66767_1 /TAXON_ID=552666 /ORGANISM="Partenskyella glossopodia, Strain RCC365" /LENGTH=319 /DNA_ID=CAMNT_0043099827 /DNA_START=32 /DNA_END=991 /DNA_ORIENTATION=+